MKLKLIWISIVIATVKALTMIESIKDGVTQLMGWFMLIIIMFVILTVLDKYYAL